MKEELLQALTRANKITGYFEKKALEETSSKGSYLLLGRGVHEQKVSTVALRDAVKSQYIDTQEEGVDIVPSESSLEKAKSQFRLAPGTSDLDKKGDKSHTKLREYLEDCYPCAARILFKNQVKMNHDNWKILVDDAWQRVANLNGYLEGSNAHRFILADICQLLQFFSIHCIPDLNKLRAVMLLYKKVLLQKPVIGKPGIWDLLNVFFLPFVSTVNFTLDRIDQLLTEPIRCLQHSLAWTMRQLQYRPVEAPPRAFEETMEDISSEVSSLGGLDFYLKQFNNYITSKATNTRNMLQEWLDSTTSQTREMRTIIAQLQQVNALIGLIQMMEKLKYMDDWAEFCGISIEQTPTGKRFVPTRPKRLLKAFLSEHIAEMKQLIGEDELKIDDEGVLLIPKSPVAPLVAEDFGPIGERIPEKIPQIIESPIRLHCIEGFKIQDSEQIANWLQRTRQ